MAQANVARRGYRFNLPIPDDSHIDRNRGARWINLILSAILILTVPAVLFWWWGSLIDLPAIGALAGFVGGGIFASRIIPDRFLINNPEWTAYVTENMFTGLMIPYGPGLHPCHWWEERTRDGNYPLEAVPLPFRVTIATTTSKVVVSGIYEHAILLSEIQHAIGVSEEVIESGITPFIDSFLLSKCAGNDAEWARSNTEALNDALAVEFMDIEVAGQSPVHFAASFGRVSVGLAIDNISFTDEVQATRDAMDKATKMTELVANVYSMTVAELKRRSGVGGDISKKEYNEMVEHAMAISNNAEMKVQVFRGDIPSAAASLAKGGRS